MKMKIKIAFSSLVIENILLGAEDKDKVGLRLLLEVAKDYALINKKISHRIEAIQNMVMMIQSGRDVSDFDLKSPISDIERFKTERFSMLKRVETICLLSDFTVDLEGIVF